MKRTWTILLLVLLACSAPLSQVAAFDEEQEKPEPRYRCEEELQVCLDWMARHFSQRGWAGLQLEVEGFKYTVTDVQPGSPAERAKIRPGDVLVAVNGVEFAAENESKLAQLQGKMKPGARFTYTIKRDGKRRNAEVKLVGMPIEVVATQVGRHLMTDHVDIDKAFPAD